MCIIRLRKIRKRGREGEGGGIWYAVHLTQLPLQLHPVMLIIMKKLIKNKHADSGPAKEEEERRNSEEEREREREKERLKQRVEREGG